MYDDGVRTQHNGRGRWAYSINDDDGHYVSPHRWRSEATARAAGLDDLAQNKFLNAELTPKETE